MSTHPNHPAVDLPPQPIWKYSEMQKSFLIGRLARLARKPYGQDHLCKCTHVIKHHAGNGKCMFPGCECRTVIFENMIDFGCDCGVCIAKDAFEQAKQM